MNHADRITGLSRAIDDLRSVAEDLALEIGDAPQDDDVATELFLGVRAAIVALGTAMTALEKAQAMAAKAVAA